MCKMALAGDLYTDFIQGSWEEQMCVLSGKEICSIKDDIFSGESWGRESFQEATYDLRVDTEPVLRVRGKLYEGEGTYGSKYMTIEPGEMALLPTMETFNMPGDLVGDIKIKFKYTRRGLAPLFGPKIDPWYGRPYPDERLYLWVSNLGIDPIRLKRGERVFTVQFHRLYGELPEFEQKDRIGSIVAAEAHAMGDEASLGFVSRIESNVERKLGAGLDRVEHGTSQVVMFGILLVASALLAGAVTVLFSMVADSEELRFLTVNTWEGMGLVIALYTVCIALTLSILAVSIVTIVQVFRSPNRMR